ncbi:MAG: hypothetical protein ABMA64_38095 [Myxococcota bacterium]
MIGLAWIGPGCDDHLIGRAAPVGTGCTREPPLTYENFGKALIARHCGSCHSDFVRGAQRGAAPLGVDFNQWEYVLEWADRIDVRVEELTMPPTGTMVQLERDLLGEWMQCEVFPALGEFVEDEGTASGGGS